MIPEPFEPKSKYPNCQTNIVTPNEIVISCVNCGEETCWVYNKAKKSLQQKYVDECTDIVNPYASSHPPIAHINVPKVFFSVTNANVNCKSKAPDWNKYQVKDYSCVDLIALCSIKYYKCSDWCNEGKSPDHIDVAVVFLYLAKEKSDNVSTENYKNWQPEINCLRHSYLLANHYLFNYFT